jgi:dipeptidyl aminopeptidase/acylaminoacyl peptidase
MSSTGELAVLTNAEYIGHRLFRGTLARMRMDGAPRPWMENVREADWSPDGSTLAIIREVGLKDQLEYPIGKILHTADGYLSDVRVSPDGEHVAFFEHQIRFDDRGWLKVVDKAGMVRTLTPEYWGAEGAAWTRDGTAVVYAAGDKGWDSFYPRVVRLDGKAASNFSVSGIGMFLFDVSSKGTWLITRNDDDRSARVLLPGDAEERELSWLGSVGGAAASLSANGRQFLFTDESESAGPTYAVSVRNMDGSLPVRLGPGAAVAFSPDGTRVLADRISPPGLVIYPVGAGEPVELPTGGLTAVAGTGWFSDGRRIIACGREPSKPFRCYQQDVRSGELKPLTPENYGAGPLSHDERTIVLLPPNGAPQLFDFLAMSARPVPGADAGDSVIAWGQDDRSLFVQKSNDTRGRLERIDVATGRRSLARELKPPDRATLMRVRIGAVIDDGAGYSYIYWKRQSRLLLARGVPQ